MMTIKEFAKLCGCSTQTLRYYDRIHLLKPVKVDEWTGYRYYEKQQAIDFVKIKNLQLADFSIDEIKHLLRMSDIEIAQAFEDKITQQKEKLEKIQQIQKSYLKEKSTMEKAIQSITELIVQSMNDDSALIEFGFQPEDGEKIRKMTREYMFSKLKDGLEKGTGELSLRVNEDVYTGAEEVNDVVATLTSDDMGNTLLIGTEEDMDDQGEWFEEGYDVVFEKHHWNHMYEFLDEIPKLSEKKEYAFKFELINSLSNSDVTIPLCMICAMVIRNDGLHATMGCSVKDSEDGVNHFWMLEKEA